LENSLYIAVYNIFTTILLTNYLIILFMIKKMGWKFQLILSI
jgi:hypothetical protein